MGALPKVVNMNSHPLPTISMRPRTVQSGEAGTEAWRSPRDLAGYFPPSCLAKAFLGSPEPSLFACLDGRKGGGSRKEEIEGKFQGVCRAAGRILILMSQRIGPSVTSLLPEKRRPGQEAAQSAGAGVKGRSTGGLRSAVHGAERL